MCCVWSHGTLTFLSGYPAWRIGDRGDGEIVYVQNVYVPSLAPNVFFVYRAFFSLMARSVLRVAGGEVWVFSVWAFCCHMWALHEFYLGARLWGHKATQRSKKGSEKVLGRVLGKGACYGFTVRKGAEEGSQKGFWEGSFQKVPRTPPRRVRPPRRAPYLQAA